MRSRHDFGPKTWLSKFALAFQALWFAYRGQSSFYVHSVCALAAIAGGLFWQVARWEWCSLILSIGLVFTTEYLNSALEELAPAIDQQYNSQLKRALDISSAAVLCAALTSVAIALLIFAQRFGTLL